MNLIAAVDKNRGIGYNGKLLLSIPEDMKFFKEKTENKVVIMGHSTLKSLPNSKPLKNRANIVLSKNPELTVEGAIVCRSLDKLFETVSCYDSNDLFVIGGQSVYQLLLPYCRCAYITRISKKFNADVYFPDIDNIKGWKIINKSEDKCYNGINYAFLEYENTRTI